MGSIGLVLEESNQLNISLTATIASDIVLLVIRVAQVPSVK
uniref:Uncharacterized protein n=2 Tax=gambiae species complex TaxID=44542 RepID=A0A1S4HCX7_ANOGA